MSEYYLLINRFIF